GDIEERRGAYVEAAKAYQAAVALAPDREEYRIGLALEFVQHQTFALAISVLEQAAPQFPKSGRIRTLLGVAYYADQRYDDAMKWLIESIRVEPALEPAYAYLAHVALELNSAPLQAAMDAI